MPTKKKSPAKKTDATETILVLRTCDADLTSHGGFRWPESGPVECPDWKPRPVCGHGLHGLPWGVGDGSLLSYDADAKWLVVAVDATSVVKIDEAKVKFPRGVVVHCGDRRSATDYIMAHGAAGKPVVGAICSVGDRGTSTSGYRGTSISGAWGTSTSGYGGTSISGAWGTSTSGYGGTSISGYGGTSTSGDRGTSTSGDRGTSTSGDEGTSTSGDRGTSTSGCGGTSTSGCGGTCASGDGGTLSIIWWDGKRHRVALGYVGEEGIKPNTPYRCDEEGKLVEVVKTEGKK